MQVLESLLHFVYPPHCLHCEALVAQDAHIFCQNCLAELILVDPKERCPTCFSAEYQEETRSCPHCKKSPPGWFKGASALDYVGPALALIKAMKYSNKPYLAKGAAGFMAAQLTHLNWPFPDVIVPVPIAHAKKFQRGYNQSELLAKQLEIILKRPVINALKRKSGDPSQASLSLKQRKELHASSFSLQKGVDIADKSILLIDDVMTTGSTLKRCAEVLYGGHPDKIYVLTVCRTI